ncbi:hypothetical protein Taro_035187 [Colocasia esculenta]|uniref:Rho-GAP domain-containing protein n=1 Tax=Colocasia esculenta TaxID=4460 RepID=A0A843W5Y4_COLES|nr:hypothetical protein [Colocasia esculenta]
MSEDALVPQGPMKEISRTTGEDKLSRYSDPYMVPTPESDRQSGAGHPSSVTVRPDTRLSAETTPGYDFGIHLARRRVAWFRELPSGVLDSLTPDQVMHCNTEEECSQLVSILPPTEAALLDWAINLMSDVVHCEHHNKMNARNIAMVFAPNMTQMADPLTALIHAVQVMNFLKMLIVKTLREREEAATAAVTLSSSSASSSPSDKDEVNMSEGNVKFYESFQDEPDVCDVNSSILDNFMLNDECVVESDDVESFWSFEKESMTAECMELIHEESLPISGNKCTAEKYKGDFGDGDVRMKDRLSFRDGVKKLCRHPVFLLSKSIKRTRDQGIVNSSIEGREAWA